MSEKEFNPIHFMREKGMSFQDTRKVYFTILNYNKEKYPFVEQDHSIKKKGKIYWKSSIEKINSFLFEKEEQVILANAIYENTKDNFNINEFVQQVKFIFRILNIESEWTK